MSYSYLASPYAHADHKIMDWRYSEAMRCLHKLLLRRQWTYSPIVHCHELAKTHQLPRDFVFWVEFNDAMLKPASELLVLTLNGWQESNGVTHEIDLAYELNIPIRFVIPTLD